jgi:predicted nucleotidyltransferase component of viral defense system
MPFDKKKLLDFLEILDKEITKEITLVAAGGTAMTLLDMKASTVDIDFTIPSQDVKEFENGLKVIPHGFRIDYWTDGMVFSQILPDDYLKKSVPIKTNLKNIKLRALHPVDIVITKIGRLDERDVQDIKACIEKFKLTKNQIKSRSKHVEYVGHEDGYRINLEYVLKNVFTKK